MSNKNNVSTVIKKYVDLEDDVLADIAKELGSTNGSHDLAAIRANILRKMEIHATAADAIEDEVLRFREQLYVTAKSIAEQEMENNILTEAHVIRARHKVWKPAGRYNFYDGFLAIGGLLGGASISYLSTLPKDTSPNLLIVTVGFVGACLLGMGIIGKART
jgi:hypothetical protein